MSRPAMTTVYIELEATRRSPVQEVEEVFVFDSEKILMMKKETRKRAALEQEYRK